MRDGQLIVVDDLVAEQQHIDIDGSRTLSGFIGASEFGFDGFPGGFADVADGAEAEAGALAPVQTITVRSVAGEKFDRITGYQLGPIPPLLDGADERIDDDVPEPVWPEDDIPF